MVPEFEHIGLKLFYDCNYADLEKYIKHKAPSSILTAISEDRCVVYRTFINAIHVHYSYMGNISLHLVSLDNIGYKCISFSIDTYHEAKKNLYTIKLSVQIYNAKASKNAENQSLCYKLVNDDYNTAQYRNAWGQEAFDYDELSKAFSKLSASHLRIYHNRTLLYSIKKFINKAGFRFR